MNALVSMFMISGMRTRGGGPCPFLEMPDKLAYLRECQVNGRNVAVHVSISCTRGCNGSRGGGRTYRVASNLGTVVLVVLKSKAAAYL
jgi:hypothetical protein